MPNGQVSASEAVQWTTNYPYAGSGFKIKQFPKESKKPLETSYLRTSS